MSTYRATVEVEGDTLHTSRPLTAPDQVVALIDSAVYAVTEDGADLTRVELIIETATESESPIGDSITASSSTPLPTPAAPGTGDDE